MTTDYTAFDAELARSSVELIAGHFDRNEAMDRHLFVALAPEELPCAAPSFDYTLLKLISAHFQSEQALCKEDFSSMVGYVKVFEKAAV